MPLRSSLIGPVLATLLAAVAACPAAAAPLRVATHSFPDAGVVTVSVPPALAGPYCAPSVTLSRNGVRAAVGRGPAWRLSVGRRSAGLTASRPRRVTLHIDAASGTVSLRGGRFQLSRHAVLRAERAVRVTVSSRPGCRAGAVTVRAEAASVARPTASGKGPAAATSSNPVAPPRPGAGATTGTGSPSSAPAAGSGTGDGRPFAADSVWNRPLADDAPLDPLSDAYAADLNRQLGYAQPWINTDRYSTAVYTVPADQPRVFVTLDEVALSAPALQRAWESVPIPPDARPADGTDRHLVVWQPATDTMWEFWLAGKQADGWHARWGGRMEHVSSNPGYFTDPPDWGATGTSLPLLGGLVRLDELASGHIDHALAIAIPEARAQWFTWPAQRTDGHVYRDDAIPEGAHFRIDPRLDLSRIPMRPAVRMLAVAAQRYGMIVRDKAGAVTFFGEDATPLGTDPYFGPDGYFTGDWLNNILRAEFPWNHLQVLRTQMACCWKRG
jgi:hypothetical protein